MKHPPTASRSSGARAGTTLGAVTLDPRTNGSDSAALLDALPQTVFRIDAEGHFVYLSAGWPRLSGYEIGPSMQRDAASFFHPADRHRFRTQISQARDQHASPAAGVSITHVRLLHADTEPRWVELHVAPLTGPQHPSETNAPPLSVVGTLANITSRVQQENQRLATQRTLSSLIGDFPGMVYRCRNNRHWTMEFVSDGARELTGYRPEDLIDNHTRSFASLIHADDSQQVWDEVQLAVNARRPFDLTYRIVTADGALKWVWERGRGIVSTSGELLGLEGFITDISRDRLERDSGSHTTLYEPRSGLCTPILFRDRLEHELKRCARTPGHQLALLNVHIDRLRSLLADSPSHASETTSTQLIELLSTRIKPWDTLCRIDPDRFAIVLAAPVRADTANDVAAVIQQTLRSPLSTTRGRIYVTASIGIAVGSAATTADSLTYAARDAMYRARSLGGARTELIELGSEITQTSRPQTDTP